MWVTVEPGNVREGQFEAAQLDVGHSVWRWQAGDSMAGGVQHSGITMSHDAAWREAMAAVERAKGAEALAAARAEGEAAGYRRAIDEACANIDAAIREIVAGGVPDWGGYDDGRSDALKAAAHAVRALAPVGPVSPADELPGSRQSEGL